MRAKVFGGSFGGSDIADINVGMDGKLKSIELQSNNTIRYTILPVQISSANVLTEQNKKSFLGKVAGGALGAFVFGGVGLIAGALAAGNKKNVLALISLKDGRSCAIEMDYKSFTAILASVKY